MRALRNRRGSAYLFVVVAVLMVTMLAAAALAVTIAGRRVSARYVEFAGLYDLAVAGNEQALFSLRVALVAALQTAEGGALTASEIYMALLPAVAAASREWDMVLFDETLRAETVVSSLPLGVDNPSDAIFRVQTQVYRVEAGMLPGAERPTVVRADIVLDAQSLTMVHSRRITN